MNTNVKQTNIDRPGGHYQATAWLGRITTAFFLIFQLWSAQAYAADPVGINQKWEGCRLNLNSVPTLPNSAGKYICDDGAYTTGNLLKNWNELDLVPYRLTTEAGNSAPATQTYTLAIVWDYLDGGKPGYDVISTPEINAAKSSSSCSITSSPVGGAGTVLTPGVGGTDQSIYRLVTITQAKGSTCVIDVYARLALGAHLYPGSSLHANLLNDALSTAGGARDISIPVKEISPQELRKDMKASQDSDHVWNLTKAADPTSISFGDVCAADFADSKAVTFRVEWTKLAATPGMITVVTNIYAKNPASRVIRVNVTDNIYKGTTQTDLLDTISGSTDVPAATELLVVTHQATLANTAGAVGDYLNDVATATYTDLATGIAVPGQTVATASAQITQGAVLNTTADISDIESITGTGLTFSVGQPLIGNFLNGYVVDSETTGPVAWQTLGETTSRFVDFNKTIYLDGKRVTTGVLTDTATLNGSNGFTTKAGPINVGISSSAAVSLTFTKSIPDILDSGEKIEVAFHISRGTDPAYSRDEVITFVGGGPILQPVTLTGLVPDNYTVSETGSVFYPSGCSASGCSIANPLVSDDPTKTANLSQNADGTISNCSATLDFVNRLKQVNFAKANVAKVTDPVLAATDPDFNWTFTLTPGALSATAGANAGTVYFEDSTTGLPLLLAEGTYTVTETNRTGWDLTNVSKPDGTTTIANSCVFKVDYPEDYDKTFTCTFSNTKRGKIGVEKTVSGKPLTGTQAFTFQLRSGATTTSDGTTLESQTANAANLGSLSFSTLLTPGKTYQLCEIVMPGWNTNLGTFGTLFVPNSMTTPTLPNPSVNNMTVCVDFTVKPGETRSFAVDNAPPPGGRGLTIGFWKNWASCAGSKGGQKPVLDQTMAKGTPPGIRYGSYYLLGNPLNPNVAPDCSKAVSLLNKATFTGTKKASDPLFNMTAQLIAAELNLVAGAYSCPGVVLAVQDANNLLSKYGFNGISYSPAISSADATKANNLAKYLDDYNNNRSGVCP